MEKKNINEVQIEEQEREEKSITYDSRSSTRISAAFV